MASKTKIGPKYLALGHGLLAFLSGTTRQALHKSKDPKRTIDYALGKKLVPLRERKNAAIDPIKGRLLIQANIQAVAKRTLDVLQPKDTVNGTDSLVHTHKVYNQDLATAELIQLLQLDPATCVKDGKQPTLATVWAAYLKVAYKQMIAWLDDPLGFERPFGYHPPSPAQQKYLDHNRRKGPRLDKRWSATHHLEQLAQRTEAASLILALVASGAIC